jgi:hypothetical protein
MLSGLGIIYGCWWILLWRPLRRHQQRPHPRLPTLHWWLPPSPFPAAPPAPAAAPPAVSAWAKTPDEKAAIIKPRASFFIVVPLYDANNGTPCQPELCWRKTLNGNCAFFGAGSLGTRGPVARSRLQEHAGLQIAAADGLRHAFQADQPHLQGIAFQCFDLPHP